ncbi:MAG: PAS domain-containing protein [Ruminococcus sp.]|nr:PAS domain-containing protein [Ruminococcus sp.]
MTKKIMGGIILISWIAIIITAVITSGILNRYYSERLEDELITEAGLISRGVELNGLSYLQSADFQGMHVLWADADGKVMFDTKDGTDDISGSTDFEEAKSEGSSSSSKFSLNMNRSSLNYSLRLSDGSVLRVSDVHLSLKDQLVSIIPSVALFLAAAALGSLLAANTVSHRIVKPVNNIDLDSPDINGSVPELRPMLIRIRSQNRKVAKQMDELRSSRENFMHITESMSEGLIVADAKLNVLSCNSAAVRLLGAKESGEGGSVYALNNSETFRRCIQNAAGGVHADAVISTPVGECEVFASPANGANMINGIVVFVMDVTEKQQLEAMRREFTSNVSHELKTPLTTIYGVSDLIANGMAKPEDVEKLSGNIRSEAERLINLINDIVALSKLDENSVPAEKEDIDLYELAGEVIGWLEMSAANKNITAALSGSHVIYKGCRTVLEEVLYNLCDNAIKYNSEGGSYAVRVSHTPKRAFLTVSDTGCGIPQQHIGRVFERFYRVDKSRSQKVKGTGLGLSIVKHGVMYHNGIVRCESRVGKGTAFTVELPM